MGKRGSNASTAASSSAGSKRSKGKAGADEDIEALLRSSSIQTKIKKSVWLKDVLDWFDDAVTKHGGVMQALEYHLVDPEACKAFAVKLDATFPPEPSVKYFSADAWDSYGRKYARSWMFGWKKHTGNKGFIHLEKFRNLLPLILVNGFESNPDEPRGQQMLVSKPNPLLYPTAADGEFPAIAGEGLLGVGELHHMKGWTRSVGLHMALLCVLESGQMDNFLKTATPHLHTYQTIFCNYVQYDSASAQIDASRGCYCCWLYVSFPRTTYI